MSVATSILMSAMRNQLENEARTRKALGYRRPLGKREGQDPSMAYGIADETASHLSDTTNKMRR